MRTTLAVVITAAVMLALPGGAAKTTTTTTSTTTTTTTSTVPDGDREASDPPAGWPMISDEEAAFRIARAEHGRQVERLAAADVLVAEAEAALAAARAHRAEMLAALKARSVEMADAADVLGDPLPAPFTHDEVDAQAELTRTTWVIHDGRLLPCVLWGAPTDHGSGPRPTPSTWPDGCRAVLQPYRIMLLAWGGYVWD